MNLSEVNEKDDCPSQLSADPITEEIDVDEAFEVTGPCGQIQCIIQILAAYIAITVAYQAVLSYFIGNEPSWKCARNDTSSFCEKYFGTSFSKDNDLFDGRCQLERDEWTYSTTNDYSFVTEFDLICKRKSMAALASGIFYIGSGVGVLFSGIAADYFGRKLILLISLCALTMLSVGSSYVSNAVQLIIIRFFLGAASVSVYGTAYVYLMEMVPPNYRSLSNNLFSLGFPISEWLIDLMAFHSHTWRSLHFYASFPSILAIFSLPFLPKSPRWLLAKDEHKKAEMVLQKINKWNGKPSIDVHLKINQRSQEETKYTFFDLFRHRTVLFLTLSVGLIWSTSSMAFYTISFESSNLGGNMYQAFALSALAEIPSKFIATYSCNRFGRKKTTLISLIFAGLFAGSAALVPRQFSHRYTVNMSLLMFAKCSADTCMIGLYLWTFELYPTILRLQGWGVCTMFEKVGSFAAPFITGVFQLINPILPYIIIMVLAIVTAAAGLILPETNKKPTRETYQDFFGNSNNSVVSSNISEGANIDETESGV